MTHAPRPVPALRTRTYEYHAPNPDPRAAAALSGPEGLGKLVTGEVPPPPIAATLGFTLVAVDHGLAVFEGMPAEWQYNPLGTVHGGWIATLLDSAVGCAVHTALRPGTGYTTLDLQVRFVRPVLATTSVVRAEGKVIHVGNRVATAEGRLVGKDDGKLYATATTSCIVLTS